MIFILLHYLLSFVTVTSSAHRFLCCVISSSAAISVPHSVRVRWYPPPPCISYARVQATVGVGTVIIVYVILIAYGM